MTPLLQSKEKVTLW